MPVEHGRQTERHQQHQQPLRRFESSEKTKADAAASHFDVSERRALTPPLTDSVTRISLVDLKHHPTFPMIDSVRAQCGESLPLRGSVSFGRVNRDLQLGSKASATAVLAARARLPAARCGEAVEEFNLLLRPLCACFETIPPIVLGFDWTERHSAPRMKLIESRTQGWNLLLGDVPVRRRNY